MSQFNRKVLVVEDDALLRSLIASNLIADGFIVQSTDSAAGARKIADDFDPDVALLDIELGNGPTGIDLAQVLRKNMPEVALGMSNTEIAAERSTTVRAVENLVKRAFHAAGIDTEAGGNPRVIAAREYIRIAGLPHGK